MTTPISDFLPKFGAGQKMTINVYHLLTQTAGLPRDTPGVTPAIMANLEQFAQPMI